MQPCATLCSPDNQLLNWKARFHFASGAWPAVRGRFPRGREGRRRDPGFRKVRWRSRLKINEASRRLLGDRLLRGRNKAIEVPSEDHTFVAGLLVAVLCKELSVKD